ncbi:hypothetical protein CALCODRAFT_504249 [Calocera cornea HHB12733]|uniref:Uncharacterized protein n=1 Tax=Calocera cornea HHB12733 TaxID=1353952 RepID=A0A165CII7_9BASI|nr:hypothetical protein CALCODRAFT_504249 [Calocera cornea HHB12733]
MTAPTGHVATFVPLEAVQSRRASAPRLRILLRKRVSVLSIGIIQIFGLAVTYPLTAFQRAGAPSSAGPQEARRSGKLRRTRPGPMAAAAFVQCSSRRNAGRKQPASGSVRAPRP